MSQQPEDLKSGEYTPAGEDESPAQVFTVSEVAAAFCVDEERVRRAVAGEFGQADAEIDARRAQHLAEELLVDQPMAEREAALMTLGAFTPRSDHMSGLGEKDPDDESDRMVRNSESADGERGPA